MCLEKCFSQENIHKLAKHGLATKKTKLKRYPMELKYTNSPVKKKFPAQQLIKKVMQTVFWDMKGTITIDFLEKDATANNTS